MTEDRKEFDEVMKKVEESNRQAGYVNGRDEIEVLNRAKRHERVQNAGRTESVEPSEVTEGPVPRIPVKGRGYR